MPLPGARVCFSTPIVNESGWNRADNQGIVVVGGERKVFGVGVCWKTRGNRVLSTFSPSSGGIVLRRNR